MNEDNYNPEGINATLGAVLNEMTNIKDFMKKMDDFFVANSEKMTELQVSVARLTTRNKVLSAVVGTITPVFLGLIAFSWAVLQKDIQASKNETELKLRNEFTAEVSQVNLSVSDLNSSVENIEKTLGGYDFIIEK